MNTRKLVVYLEHRIDCLSTLLARHMDAEKSVAEEKDVQFNSDVTRAFTHDRPRPTTDPPRCRCGAVEAPGLESEESPLFAGSVKTQQQCDMEPKDSAGSAPELFTGGCALSSRSGELVLAWCVSESGRIYAQSFGRYVQYDPENNAYRVTLANGNMVYVQHVRFLIHRDLKRMAIEEGG